MSGQFTSQLDPGNRRRRRLILTALIIALLCVGGIAAKTLLQNVNEAPLKTVVVTTGNIEKTVTSLGKLKAKDYVDVGTQVSGQLKSVHVKIGDRVNKGNLIAEIDPTVYETRVRTDKANLDNLRAQLIQQQSETSLAQQLASRNQGLLKERAISQETVESNLSSLEVAEAKVAAIQAQIRAGQATLDGDVANLGYTKIYSPMSGTVVSQTSLEGQTVNAAQQAPVIVRIANLETMTVWAQVAEADVVKVKVGTPAYFTILGNTTQRWQGKVRQVMPTPETVNDVVLYNVLIDVDNRHQTLMSDMTVQVFFVLDAAKDVPVVPLNALQPLKSEDPNLYEARVATADGIVSRTVKVGISNRSTATVVSGLTVGEKIVIPQALPAKTQSGNDRTAGPPMGARL